MAIHKESEVNKSQGTRVGSNWDESICQTRQTLVCFQVHLLSKDRTDGV